MMNTRLALAFVVGMFLSGVTSQHADAQVTHIKIENQLDPSPIAKQYTQLGGWSVLHSTGSYTCQSGTTNKYTISGNATLVAYDTTSPDYIMFHDATITADNSGVCGRIFFWTKVLPGPSGTVDLNLSSAGSLKRGSSGAVGSWVHFSGWLQHPATTGGEVDGTSGTWEHVGSLSGPPASRSAQDKHVTSPTPSSAWSWPPSPSAVNESPDLTGITSARIMKGEIWFYLANSGDKLILNAGSGVQVTTAAGGGGGGDGGGIDLCDFFNCELLEQLRDPSTPGRLERIEKHLKLPPFTQPEPVPNPLDEKHMSPQP